MFSFANSDNTNIHVYTYMYYVYERCTSPTSRPTRDIVSEVHNRAIDSAYTLLGLLIYVQLFQ